MIEKLKIQDFHKVYDLIEMSFSSDEYRTYDEQKALTDGRKNLVYTTNWIFTYH